MCLSTLTFKFGSPCQSMYIGCKRVYWRIPFRILAYIMSAPRALCEHPTPYIVIFSCFSAAYTHLESYNMSPMIPLFWKLLTFYFRLTYFMQLGGMNSFLLTEFKHSIPLFSKIPTLVIGMDVSHGSQGQSEALSIAAVWYNFRFSCHYILSVILTISTQCLPNIIQVVSSRCWPQISRYKAVVRTQSSKVEIVQSLFKPVSDTKDDGIIRFVFSNECDYFYKLEFIRCCIILSYFYNSKRVNVFSLTF